MSLAMGMTSLGNQKAVIAAGLLEIVVLMQGYNISRYATQPLLTKLLPNPIEFLRFMMNFKHQIQKPSSARPIILTGIMFLGYSIAGILPLLPYFFMVDILHTLFVSIAISIVSISTFGFFKDYLTIGTKRAGMKGALETVLVGAITGGAAYRTGKLINITVPA